MKQLSASSENVRYRNRFVDNGFPVIASSVCAQIVSRSVRAAIMGFFETCPPKFGQKRVDIHNLFLMERGTRRLRSDHFLSDQLKIHLNTAQLFFPKNERNN